MRVRPFGSTGIDVPVIGQGTWKLAHPDEAERSLRAGMDLGLTHIDTAELYTGAEQIVARAIAGRRDEVFLVSKVLPDHARRDDVHRACEQSLARLGTDHLDVYLLHWPSDDVPLAETMEALSELVDQGKTRFIGVSNFEIEELEAARSHARHPIVCNQVLYHLGDRGIENGLIEHCGNHEIAVVAYSPFGSGVFPPEHGDASALNEISHARGVSPHQVALAFLSHAEPLFVIPKAERTEHVRDNAAADGITLTEAERERLDAAFPRPSGTALGMI